MKPDEIYSLRKSRKLNQEALGAICGVTKGAVSSWENGRRDPSGAALKILEELRDGKITVSELSPLEIKLLDKNVEEGNFNSREDYLTQSLKYLLTHGKFMPLYEEDNTPLSLVAEEAAEYNSKKVIDSDV